MRSRHARLLPLVLLPGVVAGSVALVLGTSAFAAQKTAQRSPTPTFTLKASVAGGIRVIQSDQTLTFVFTETNEGPGSAPVDLDITGVTNAEMTGNPPCVLPNGSAINLDSPFCEPGFLRPGQSASVVVTTQVTGSSGQTVSVRVCLDNENTGATGPCVTKSVPIA